MISNYSLNIPIDSFKDYRLATKEIQNSFREEVAGHIRNKEYEKAQECFENWLKNPFLFPTKEEDAHFTLLHGITMLGLHKYEKALDDALYGLTYHPISEKMRIHFHKILAACGEKLREGGNVEALQKHQLYVEEILQDLQKRYPFSPFPLDSKDCEINFLDNLSQKEFVEWIAQYEENHPQEYVKILIHYLSKNEIPLRKSPDFAWLLHCKLAIGLYHLGSKEQAYSIALRAKEYSPVSEQAKSALENLLAIISH